MSQLVSFVVQLDIAQSFSFYYEGRRIWGSHSLRLKELVCASYRPTELHFLGNQCCDSRIFFFTRSASVIEFDKILHVPRTP